MKPRELVNYIPTEQEIKNSIDGYFSLTPTDDNKYYKSFEKNWLNFKQDIERYNNCDHGNSYLLIVQAAEEHKNTLYERCSIKFQEIRNIFDNAIGVFETKEAELEEKNAVQLLRILKIWKEVRENCLYALGIDCTKKGLNFSKFKEDKIGHPFGSYNDFITEVLSNVESLLDQLCMLFAQHLGMSCAMRCLFEQGSFPSCEDFVTRNWDGFEFSLDRVIDKDLSNLLNMGHLVDPAIKLRFNSLVEKSRYSHKEAHSIIESELNALGLKPEDFPDEPKVLADRARRHRDKIYNELSLLSENISS